MSDLRSRHPHNASKYNLPRITSYLSGTISYRIEHLTGMFPKWIALIQYELNGHLCTGVLYTEAYMFADGESYLWINTTPIFDNLKKEFPRNLAKSIRNKFPHLDQLTKVLEDYSDLKLKFGYTANFGNQSYGAGSFFKLNVSEPNSLLMDTFTAAAVEALFSFVINAENEYKSYKQSCIFKYVTNQLSKAEQAAMPATVLYALYRIARIGFSIYNGNSDNDTSFSPDLNLTDDFSSDYMADYLCSDANSDSEYNNDSSQISFTGSGDKYMDDEYNREQAEKWFKKEEECLKKGDTSGAAAAHSTAMKHQNRIKK